MSRRCVHVYVSGKVQGVGYRANTQRQAIRLGLTGWVKNLPDGRVEIYACGEQFNVANLIIWLKKGPPLAQVKHVSIEESFYQKHSHFNVL